MSYVSFNKYVIGTIVISGLAILVILLRYLNLEVFAKENLIETQSDDNVEIYGYGYPSTGVVHDDYSKIKLDNISHNTADKITSKSNLENTSIHYLFNKSENLGIHFHENFQSTKDAINYLENTILNGNASSQVMSTYVITYLMSGDTKKGIEFLKEYSYLNPVEFFIGLGSLYFQESDVKSSRIYYEEAVSSGIKADIKPLENLANFELSQGNSEKVINSYENFLDEEYIASDMMSQEVIDDNRLRAQSELVQIYINTGSYEKANSILYKLYAEGVNTAHLQHYYNQINHLEEAPVTYEYVDKDG